MLFWITIGVLAVGFILLLLTFVVPWEMEGVCFGTGITLVVLSTIAGATMLFMIAIGNINPEAKLAAKQARYENLIYQIENDFYDNENDRGKFELMQKVADWNADLAYGRRMQDDFWCGIFWADIYHELEFIELEDYN